MIFPLDEAWREMARRVPATSSVEERLALWRALWPRFQEVSPVSAWARIHPAARDGATVWLCELGAAWCAAHRFPERAERDAELYLWEAAHAGSRRALDRFARESWRDPFYANPAHRLADLLRRAARFDSESLAFLWPAFGGDDALPTSTDGAGGSNDALWLLKRGLEDAGTAPEIRRCWELRERLRQLERPSAH